MSQLPGGRPLSLCRPPPPPALPAFSLVTDIEGSWTLSFLLSWEEETKVPGGFGLYVKLLGAPTSTTQGLNSGLGIWREPSTVGTKTLQVVKQAMGSGPKSLGLARKNSFANPLLEGCVCEASSQSSHLPSVSPPVMATPVWTLSGWEGMSGKQEQ